MKQSCDHPTIVEKIMHHASYNNNRNEMRQVADGLNRALKCLISEFIEKECKNNRGWKTENEIQYIQYQRVSKGPHKICAGKKTFEISQADPLASPNAFGWGITFKGDDHAIHRNILENNIIRQNKGKNGIDEPVLSYIIFKALFFPLICLRR